MGIDFSTYSKLYNTPVINAVDGSASTQITQYNDGRMFAYSSCQGNCQVRTNSDSTGGSDHGFVDIAYMEFPSVRSRAFYWLTQRETWKDKIRALLHYHAVEAHTDYTGNQGSVTSGVDPWESIRRFGVWGDGTLVMPKEPSRS